MSKQKKGPAGKQNRTVITQRRLPPPEDWVVQVYEAADAYLGWGTRWAVHLDKAARMTAKKAKKVANQAKSRGYPEAVAKKA